MHVIGTHLVTNTFEKYPEHAAALSAWFYAVKDARWRSLDDIRSFDKHAHFER